MNTWAWHVGFLILGGALLYFGAEWLVRGGASLARRLGISPLVVGLTVVAYGTSAPEVVVGLQAGLGGHGELALGNVVGSNIANLGLILGGTALLRPASVNRELLNRSLPLLAIVTLAVPLLFWDGLLSRLESMILVAGSVVYTLWMVRTSKVESQVEEVGTSGEHAPGSLGGQVLLVLVGLGTLVGGGHVLVRGASGMASALGMSERVIGLTVVAVGTSLPELATSLVAAAKGHTDMAIGNVVGSNLFNLTMCLGTAGLAGRILTPAMGVGLDLAALLGLTLLSCVLMWTGRLVNRLEGGLLLALYAVYLGLLVMGV